MKTLKVKSFRVTAENQSEKKPEIVKMKKKLRKGKDKIKMIKYQIMEKLKDIEDEQELLKINETLT